MADTIFKDVPVHTSGDLPAVGSRLPHFELTRPDLSALDSDELAGKRVVLNIFPSVDTGVCATSVRTFNQLAAGLANTVVVCVSKDLPFALGRFCGAEGIENVTTVSAFRSSFGDDYGVTMANGAGAGLFARAVVVADEHGTVRYTDVTPTVHVEPNYDAAIAALG
ncbi:MAG: thiol peroxidase [Propionicimonas sp.]|uniref:thiol peroxidase n=1 Tax=Propionicimonas sp. TaxID=1955623 RepID=UPI002B1EEDF7|nr:thiol peroxidase [Propionicimonas sp.]MEA4944065.1 thiol peroxidase [Propionicimonas sp.]MEA5055256.1 thiol peroxidase [Propionicimonas sp.]MEA5118394.1 thiol peroxidase [Propionicimonas sp.]